MIEWLGISHLFELSRTEAVAGFFTPLVIYVLFFLVQLIYCPGGGFPGTSSTPETGEPRSYRLNGLLVFAVAMIVWALELTGLPRDWFFRSSIYAVAGGTVFTTLFTIIAVFSQPPGKVKNPLLALWFGRARELSFFSERIDVKMYMYVVGGTMLSLNALSGAAYHYELFGEDYNPGVFLYAAFFTFYILDYFIFERVQLYTYDLIHEDLGLQAVLGRPRGLRVDVHPPAVGDGRLPGPRILAGVEEFLAHRNGCAVSVRVGNLARRQPAEIHLQAMARPQVPRAHRAGVHPGR